MSIYPITTIEASARQAAVAQSNGNPVHCPYPAWHEAADVWHSEFDAECERLELETA